MEESNGVLIGTREPRDFWASFLLEDKYFSIWQFLDSLMQHLEGFRYEFMDVDEYRALLRINPVEGMSVYWREMLYRAHWAAATSLIRAYRWQCGLLDALADHNVIVFCACSRGLIESCSDAWYSLHDLPGKLTTWRDVIIRSLRLRQRQVICDKDLEDLLIHFSFATKKTKGMDLPQQHISQQTAQYIKNFGSDQEFLLTLYGELCDITHPGALSVQSFVQQPVEDETKVNLTFKKEIDVLGRHVKQFREFVPILLVPSLEEAILTLRELNTLPAMEVRTHFVNSNAPLGFLTKHN